jgi:hypothetical protein
MLYAQMLQNSGIVLNSKCTAKPFSKRGASMMMVFFPNGIAQTWHFKFCEHLLFHLFLTKDFCLKFIPSFFLILVCQLAILGCR